ncbi:MAG TPA: trypsin-like peptidase domain-containing protein [Verrucomicrobiae bacterium]|nr:trypsin-like peptidase domain-containing protein [Verrucomicrobiae bacterium]
MSLLRQLADELRELIARAVPAVVGVEHRRAQGTGFLIAPDGYVVTNAHVVAGAADLKVTLRAGDDARAELAGADPSTDLAVLRIAGGGLPSLPLADDRKPRVGEIVVAVGNPLHFDRSVSLGVVSALDRTLPAGRGVHFEGLIQTDAAINPGNSGGPLLDADGTAIGINTAVVPYAQGIGFAIPARTATWVASVLIRKGRVERPYLGIAARGEDLDGYFARASGSSRAIRIVEVASGAPADAAGLRRGDRIVAVSGEKVESVDDLQRRLVLGDPGELSLQVIRAGGALGECVVRPSTRP